MARARACAGGILLDNYFLVGAIRDNCGHIDVRGSRAGDNIIDCHVNIHIHNRRAFGSTDNECGRV